MEFHNAKLLPKGLPEIMVQFMPDCVYDDMKVIVSPEKEKPGLRGQAHFETGRSFIRLWPTIMAFFKETRIGTYSFRLWHSFLHTALHEIGHFATADLYDVDDEAKYEHNYDFHSYVEKLANDWSDRAMARLLAVNPRLGQPEGRLTGYPGILAYEYRKFSQETINKERSDRSPHYDRILEWRGMKCNGQITMTDIAGCLRGFIHNQFPTWREDSHPRGTPCYIGSDFWEPTPGQPWTGEGTYGGPEYRLPEGEPVPTVDYDKQRRDEFKRLYRAIHWARKELGITRFFVNRHGWTYAMFNVGEAESVFHFLSNQPSRLKAILFPAFREWVWGEGHWDQVEVEKRQKIPRLQLRLPLARCKE